MSPPHAQGTRDSRKGSWVAGGQCGRDTFPLQTVFLNFLDFVPCEYITYSKNKYNYKKKSTHTHALVSSSGNGICPSPATVPVFPGAQERGLPTLSGWPVVRATQTWGCCGEFLLEKEATPRGILMTLKHFNLPTLALFSCMHLVCFKNS